MGRVTFLTPWLAACTPGYESHCGVERATLSVAPVAFDTGHDILCHAERLPIRCIATRYRVVGTGRKILALCSRLVAQLNGGH